MILVFNELKLTIGYPFRLQDNSPIIQSMSFGNKKSRSLARA